MGEVLNQVWLRNECSEVHTSSCKPTKKVCDENERNKQRRKNDKHVKMLLMEGGHL